MKKDKQSTKQKDWFLSPIKRFLPAPWQIVVFFLYVGVPALVLLTAYLIGK
jgi:hypothetical protein